MPQDAPAEPAADAAPNAAGLAELMAAFNEVTARLEATHAQLRGEVERLRGELREANDQLERSRRLAGLGEMAAGIAHEMRNPLGCIGLYARMLEEDLAAPIDDPAEQRETADKILAAVRRLDAIVGDVLSFAKETRLRQEHVSAAELLDDAWDAARPEADTLLGDRLTLVRRGPAVDFKVWCDPILTHRALVNIITNAVQAMAERGGDGPHAICLDASLGFLRPPEDEPHRGRRRAASVVVRDTGPGIPDDVVARMFNPFFTTRHTGTGLGLAIVHRIVDAHGGAVRVASPDETAGHPGHKPWGTAVELKLPLRQPAASAIEPTGIPRTEPPRDAAAGATPARHDAA